jgi:hypothetical protein
MAITLIASIGVAWYSFWIASKVGGIIRRDAKQVVEDMDDIYGPHKKA